MVIYSLSGPKYYCTAWFIGKQHVATAGHCVVDWGPNGPFYMLDPSKDNHVCCKFRDNGSCYLKAKWRVTKWVTTTGFFVNAPSRANDGAVLKVEPVNATRFTQPVPQALTTFVTQPQVSHRDS